MFDKEPFGSDPVSGLTSIVEYQVENVRSGDRCSNRISERSIPRSKPITFEEFGNRFPTTREELDTIQSRKAWLKSTT